MSRNEERPLIGKIEVFHLDRGDTVTFADGSRYTAHEKETITYEVAHRQALGRGRALRYDELPLAERDPDPTVFAALLAKAPLPARHPAGTFTLDRALALAAALEDYSRHGYANSVYRRYLEGRNMKEVEGWHEPEGITPYSFDGEHWGVLYEEGHYSDHQVVLLRTEDEWDDYRRAHR